MSLNYYCYYCQCRIKAIRRPLPTCSICLQQFVEELPSSSSSLNAHTDELSQSNEFYDTVDMGEESNEEEEDIFWYQAESDGGSDDILSIINPTINSDNHHHSRSHQQDINSTDRYQQNQFTGEWFLQENSDDNNNNNNNNNDDDEYETQIILQNTEPTQENEDAFRLHDFLDNENGNEEDDDNGSESTYNDYLTTYALLYSNQRQQQQQNQPSTRSNNDSSSSSPFSNIERLLNIIYQGFYESDNEIDDGDHQGFLGNLMEMFNDSEDSTHPPSDENLDVWINLLDKRYLQEESTDDKNECTICQEDFGIFNELIRMPCKHEYHGTCIRQWLEVNPTCPICRCHASTILESKSSSLELDRSSSSWDRAFSGIYSTTEENSINTNDDSLEDIDHQGRVLHSSNDIQDENDNDDDDDDFYEVSESAFNWVNASLS